LEDPDQGEVRLSDPVWGIQIKPKPQPIRPLLEQVAVEGYGLVEWRSPTVMGTTQPEWDMVSDQRSAQEIREVSRGLGLSMAYHAPQGDDWHFGTLPRAEAETRLNECVDRARSVGATTMTLHLGIEEGEGRERAVVAGAKAVLAVAPRAVDEGILLCVENVFDRHSVSTVADCEMMFDTLGDAAMLTLDTGHGNLTRTLQHLVERFGDRIGFTHVHDNDGTKDQHFVPGSGTINWVELITLLDKADYRGPLSFELREEATFESLTRFIQKQRTTALE